ncbi:hypothetical protein [Kribbella sancticallisti]|uniref:hypothetical protein n=1 Tax=Kribbella sancticallisti TaxID=460087 RepID=UPI0031E29059
MVAAIAAWGTWSATHFGADEERERESREKRSQIYADYLTAARSHADQKTSATYAQMNFHHEQKQVPARVSANVSAARMTYLQAKADAARKVHQLEWREYLTTFTAYRKQVDLVYVYGSDAAWQAHLTVDRAIGDDPDEPLSDAADDLLSAGLGQLQVVFCQEASATPRRGCSG